MGSRLQRIEDVEVVEVGRFYLVPTKIVKHWPKSIQICPIIGPLHEDAEFIKFPDKHWHPDRRFVSDAFFSFFAPNHWGAVLTPHPTPRLLPHLSRLRGKGVFSDELKPVAGVHIEDGGVRRLKCKRLTGSFGNVSGIPWLRKLENAYRDQTLRDGHICPHRGISCRGVVQSSPNHVVCPGHGLQFNLNTGRVVKRVEVREYL